MNDLDNFDVTCRFAEDLVVCVALGCDMFDCVFPTRTAVSTYIICWHERTHTQTLANNNRPL